MLGYRLDLREILVAGVEFYRGDGGTHPAPLVTHFPSAELLRDRRVLVIDEVWETGETMAEVVRRVRDFGRDRDHRRHPLQAGPVARRVDAGPPRRPAHGWVTYPYKAGG